MFDTLLQSRARRQRSASGAAASITAHAEPPATIQLVFPRLDLPAASSDLISITDSPGAPPLPVVGSGDASAGETPPDSSGVFQESEVEKAVSLGGGGVTPKYPESLRFAGVEGRVIAEFVVDERGRAEVDSVRFTRSDNRLFEDAVKVALRRMQFVPAEIGGRKVRQLVQMPFVFTLNR